MTFLVKHLSLLIRGPLGVIVAGIYRGKCPKLDIEKIKTQDGVLLSFPSGRLEAASIRDDIAPWTAEALIENTGIMIIDELTGEATYYFPPKHSIGADGEPKYGYRKGTETEVKELGYTLKPLCTPRRDSILNRV